MSVGRNDPCPCGSGKKYKACCRERDRALGRDGGGGGGPDAGAILASEPWQVDVVPVPARLGDAPGSRPALVLVTVGSLPLHTDVLAHGPTGVHETARVLEQVLRATGGKLRAAPAAGVWVRHPEVAAVLSGLLRGWGGPVEAGDLGQLDGVADAVTRSLLGKGTVRASSHETWAGWKLPPARVAELFRAAAVFYRARPWRMLDNLQVVYVRTPAGREWTACILGNGGCEFGLALHADPDDVLRLLDADGSGAAFASMRRPVLSLTFEPADELSPAMRREVAAAGWEVAGPKAYPHLIVLNTPGGGLTPDDAADLALALRAVVQAPGRILGIAGRASPENPLEWTDAETGAVLRYQGRIGDVGLEGVFSVAAEEEPLFPWAFTGGDDAPPPVDDDEEDEDEEDAGGLFPMLDPEQAAIAEAETIRAAREAVFWEADAVPFPVQGREAAGAMVLVMAGGFVVHGDVLPRCPATMEERARAVAAMVLDAERQVEVFPRRLHVRDAALADAVSRELKRPEVVVEAAPLADLDEALSSAREHLGGFPAPELALSLSSWSQTGATVGALEAFHRAAAGFHEARPWAEPEQTEPLLLAFPDETAWVAVVMGDGEGDDPGLALYSDPETLLTAAASGEDPGPEKALERLRAGVMTVRFAPDHELPPALRREVAAGGWPLAGPGAYPVLTGMYLPEQRITAAHVERMTLTLRAVTLLARGEDPFPATGVTVDRLEDLVEDGESIDWTFPDQPGPMCATGPGADPEGALRGPDARDEVARAERERLKRLEAWLAGGGRLPRAMRKADLHNARCWTEYLEAGALPAGAVTEYDLRLYLYHYYPLHGDVPKVAVRHLRGSLERLFRFLEVREGVRYPFAAAALEELEAIEEQAAEEGVSLQRALHLLSDRLAGDLFARAMLHDPNLPDVPGAWASLEEGSEALRLEGELQRRWLLWYDEAVRGGITGWDALEEALLARQRAWEATPHPSFGGRTPAEVVRALSGVSAGPVAQAAG